MGAKFSSRDLAAHLNQNDIGNRMLFGGNLIRQPVFVDLRKDLPKSFRIAYDLAGADCLMNSSVFMGTYPGISVSMIGFITNSITKLCLQLANPFSNEG